MTEQRRRFECKPGNNAYTPAYWEECTMEEWDQLGEGDREIFIVRNQERGGVCGVYFARAVRSGSGENG